MATSAVDVTRERFHPRVDAGFMVKLRVNGRALLCKTRDLSMAGVFVEGELAGLGEKVTIEIPLPGDKEIVTSCFVRRFTEEGVALEFEHIDWDDMFALARYLHPRLP